MHAIDGSFTQAASGILALRVVSAGVSDALSVSGTAGLGGRLAAVVQPGLYGNTTTYSGVDLVPLLEQANRVQLGGGVSVRMNATVSFYANADYQFSVGDTDGGRRNGIRGAAGVRYTW